MLRCGAPFVWFAGVPAGRLTPASAFFAAAGAAAAFGMGPGLGEAAGKGGWFGSAESGGDPGFAAAFAGVMAGAGLGAAICAAAGGFAGSDVAVAAATTGARRIFLHPSGRRSLAEPARSEAGCGNAVPP